MIFVANALPLIFGCSAFLYFSYRRLRAKGYPPPKAAVIIFAACVAGIALTVFAARRQLLAWFWFEYFWMPLLLSAAAMAILLLVLPRRPARVSGQRSAHFLLLWSGGALIGFALALMAGALVLWADRAEDGDVVVAALTLTAVVALTALYLIRRGQRAKSVPSVENVLAKDSRPIVVYLRAFLKESRAFVIGRKSECGSNAKSWHAAVAGPEANIAITFEEYLAEALSTSIGPFVALGSPEDYLPPEGALRTYVDDSRWKEVFHRFADQSMCIVAEVGISANLSWEFTQIRQECMQEKLFVFTPCSTAGHLLQWAFWNLLWFLKGLHRVRWREFTKELGKLGFEIGFEDPGPESVIFRPRRTRRALDGSGLQA